MALAVEAGGVDAPWQGFPALHTELGVVMVSTQNFVGLAEDQKEQFIVDFATVACRKRLLLPSDQATDALPELASLHIGVQHSHDVAEVISQSPEAL